jgi:hypothetical protein
MIGPENAQAAPIATNRKQEEPMKKYTRLLAVVIAVGFLLSLVPACSLFSGIADEIKKKGETLTVKKGDIGDSIKTKKYGKFKLSKSHVKDLKGLKKGKHALFYKVKAKKGKKKTTIVVYVVRISKSKFQVSVMKQPDKIPLF